MIGNLLKAVLDAADEDGVDVRADPARRRRTRSLDDRGGPGEGRRATSAARLDDGRANLAAGTTWLWASPKMVDAVDVLFVDEAGQISLANVVAIAARDRRASSCSATRSSSTSR